MLDRGGGGRVRAPRFRRLLQAAAILAGVVLLGALGGGVWLRARLRASLPLVEGHARPPGAAGARDRRAGRPGGAHPPRAPAGWTWPGPWASCMPRNGSSRWTCSAAWPPANWRSCMGPPVLAFDRRYRIHRFRDVARRVLAQASPGERAVLEAYAAGVNAGLGALGARPFEYLLLRADPAPWRPEDSVLCLLAMFIQLQEDPGERQSRLGYMRDVLPPALLAFLAPPGTEWDAPCAAPRPPAGRAGSRGVRPAQAQGPPGPAPPTRNGRSRTFPGSNNWALGGGRTRDGRAIVANDMHLAITVPNTWYRASLAWPEAGGERRVTGVTLPGTPSVAAGSNGRVAWGFTNSYGDFRDLVVLERCGDEIFGGWALWKNSGEYHSSIPYSISYQSQAPPF